ncbi:MraY family glycosyltransferase [Nodosilinea sp. E11]|uniref:glycosyltransferase family 4 protein n=1 Tax=Nodosilinea sp. E11 TaxID=3037479 RepID=UPI0029341532|nr:MraY family glycosyltransferase [Nodosilinea sp. E11]WOD41515.1 MraY family glycosyltransferase [Nodosilinea sp. E11]
MFPWIVPGAAALTVVGLTPLVQKIGFKFGYIDQPNARKIHRQPIVRIGGVGIFIGTFTSWILTDQLMATAAESSIFLALLLGGIGFFATGLMDDLFDLSPFARLGIQALLSAGVWHLGIRLDALPLPGLTAALPAWLSLLVTFLWLAGMANAINWLDGMDGLAAGTATVAAVVLAALAWPTQPAIAGMALGLAGATLGFLRYNAAPARIFMGDGGSYFLGFALAAIALVGLPHDGSITTALLPFLVLLIPVLDMTLVIGARLSDRKSPFFPDQRHIHHRLMHANFPKATVVWSIYSLTLLSGLSALLLLHSPLGWWLLSADLALFSLTMRSLWLPTATPAMSLPTLTQ